MAERQKHTSQSYSAMTELDTQSSVRLFFFTALLLGNANIIMLTMLTVTILT